MRTNPRTIRARIPGRGTAPVQRFSRSRWTAAANFTIVIMWLLLLVGLLW